MAYKIVKATPGNPPAMESKVVQGELSSAYTEFSLKVFEEMSHQEEKSRFIRLIQNNTVLCWTEIPGAAMLSEVQPDAANLSS